MARRPEFHIGECDGRSCHLHLAGRSYRYAGYFIAVFLFHLLDQVIVGKHLKAVVLGDLDAVLIDLSQFFCGCVVGAAWPWCVFA